MILVLVGPGGSGKTTLADEIVKRDTSIKLSQSWTTRKRRSQESPSAYNFVSDVEFEEKEKSDGFIETDEICGHKYGTPKANIADKEKVLVILTADGAINLQQQIPETEILFIDTPSIWEQKKRLAERGDTYIDIAKRTITGLAERKKARKHNWKIIINRDLVETTDAIYAHINTHTTNKKAKQ